MKPATPRIDRRAEGRALYDAQMTQGDRHQRLAEEAYAAAARTAKALDSEFGRGEWEE